MTHAVLNLIAVDFTCDNEKHIFRATGSSISKPGFMAVYLEGKDDSKESARFLSNILASIQDGISILDKDMKILMVNPTMKQWYAHALPFLGKKCYEAYYGATQRCSDCPTYETIMTGEPSCKVVPRRRPKNPKSCPTQNFHTD
jgi:transcriptional regulator with PAS, ATPase and Fis domain